MTVWKRGFKRGAVLQHMLFNPVEVLKEADVAELVKLIKADGLHRDLLLELFHIPPAAPDRRDAGAREGDFRGGAEHDDHILATHLLALVHQV